MAVKMITIPTTSRQVKVVSSGKRIALATTANTDSKLISSDATVAGVCFCPRICSV